MLFVASWRPRLNAQAGTPSIVTVCPFSHRWSCQTPSGWYHWKGVLADGPPTHVFKGAHTRHPGHCPALISAFSQTHAALLSHVQAARRQAEAANVMRLSAPADGPWTNGRLFSRANHWRALMLICHLYLLIIVEHGEEAFPTCFSAFRKTLRGPSFSTFVTLVDCFPKFTTLRLNSVEFDPIEGPVPPLSRPLVGKISFGHANSSCLEFLNRLVKLDLKYDGLVVGLIVPRAEILKSMLQISSGTVKYLKLALWSPKGGHHDLRRHYISLLGP